ncbi:MAG: efflux RND transporter periplasmic adaptor subunit, partial [Gammaproteobacteria bacterium]|nr:efflux RND transporter periplasmic adaptor subunit [Gammaproteobacteria bacterium]
VIQQRLTLTGRVVSDPDRMSHVRARYAGLVQRLYKRQGDVVKAGELLARVQSNQSLQSYDIHAPISGVIVQRETQPGEITGETPLFIIADLSQVWVQLDVFSNDLKRIKEGQSVIINTMNGQQLSGKIDWISPLSVHATQSVRARVITDNPGLQLRPGQFVRGVVTYNQRRVPLAIETSSLQRIRDIDVVFVRVGESYEMRMPKLGIRDDKWVEVISGLKPGADYVTNGSYLIKADIEKSGASHDH